MTIELKLDFRQALEVKTALEMRKTHIEEKLLKIFQNDEILTNYYKTDIELLEGAINQIKSHYILKN